MKLVDASSYEDEVLKSDIPVVVDFFAEWCGPCRQMLPIFEELEKNNPGFKFVKVNIDGSEDVASQYGIQSLPTFIVLKNGKEIDRKSGALNKSKAVAWMETLSK